MYGMEFTSNAESDLSRLDAPIAQRVLKRLRWRILLHRIEHLLHRHLPNN